MIFIKPFNSGLRTNMSKAACHSVNVDSSNPCRWRGERLHHHGGGVCWLFVLLWMDSWRHELIVCKKWYKNNLKMRLTALLFDALGRAPHLMIHIDFFPNLNILSHLVTYNGNISSKSSLVWNILLCPSPEYFNLRHFFCKLLMVRCRTHSWFI